MSKNYKTEIVLRTGSEFTAANYLLVALGHSVAASESDLTSSLLKNVSSIWNLILIHGRSILINVFPPIFVALRVLYNESDIGPASYISRSTYALRNMILLN
jgi:hypothetical protein